MKNEYILLLAVAGVVIGTYAYKRTLPNLSRSPNVTVSEPVLFFETQSRPNFTSEANPYRPLMNQTLPPPNVNPEQGQKFENPYFDPFSQWMIVKGGELGYQYSPYFMYKYKRFKVIDLLNY